jgi:hypothetical protein
MSVRFMLLLAMFLAHAPETLPYVYITEILVRFIDYVYGREFADTSCFRYRAS